MKKLFFSLLTITCVFSSFGQTTIALQDFEDTPATPTMSYTSDGTTSDGLAGAPTNDDSHAASGTKGLIVTNGTMTFESGIIDASSYTSAELSFRLASLASTTGNGADAGEIVTVSISTDGGSTYSDELTISGASNARWGFQTGTGEANATFDGDNTPTAFSPASGGGRTTDGYSTVIVSSITNSSSLKIKIVAANNSTTETWAIDDVSLSGISASDPQVGFDSSTSDEIETTSTFSVSIPVTLSNYTADVTLDVNLTGGTAESGDYDLTTAQLNFTSATTLNVTIDIIDDSDFADETIEITLTENTTTGITITSAVHTLTITDDDTPSLVINEILADPPGDANGDGVPDTGDDEFIEFVNTGTTDIDMSGWIVADGLSDRHTFPAGTILSPSRALVLFADGVPSGSFGGALVQVSNNGTLGLNNGGDDVILKTADGTVILSVTYGSATDESFTLSPDLTGTLTKHTDADTDDNSTYSPGTKLDGTFFSAGQTVTWDGSESAAWSDPANWDVNTVPTPSDDVVIVSSTPNDPVLSIEIAVNDINIASGATLTVESGAALAIFGSSTGTGELTVKRNTTGSGGYSILGSPVVGAQVADLSADFIHDYSTTSSSFVAPPTDLVAGKGYFVGYSSETPEVSFTGTPVTGTQSTLVTKVTDGDGFNIVANPYSAPIYISSFLANTANSTATDGTIYLWDDGGENVDSDRAGDYITVNNIGTVAIAEIGDLKPGAKGVTGAESGVITSTQGFFVNALSTTDVQFTADMQAVTAGKNDDVNHYRQASSEIQKLKISLSGNGSYSETLIGLSDRATPERDYSLDALRFSVNTDIALYSIQDDYQYAIQALPSLGFDELKVPLGFSVSKAGNYEFNTIENSGFEEASGKFLFDTESNKMTDLSGNGNYTFYTEAVTNSDRFKILLTPAEILRAPASELTDFKVFANNERLNLETSEPYDNITIEVFSLDGASLLKAKNVIFNKKSWSIPFTEKGIFIMTIETREGMTCKKFLN